MAPMSCSSPIFSHELIVDASSTPPSVAIANLNACIAAWVGSSVATWRPALVSTR